jgi:hypothetical protein
MGDTRVYKDIDGWKTYSGVRTFSGKTAVRIVDEIGREIAIINVHGQLKMVKNDFNQFGPALININSNDEDEVKQAVRLAYLMHRQARIKYKR